MAIVMDGKALADKICIELKGRCDVLRNKGIYPKLTIVTSGDDNASQVYVRNKVKRCEEIGIEVDARHHALLGELDISLLCAAVDNPMIVQEPIAGNGTHADVAKYIMPWYDVDGFSEFNVSALAMGLEPIYYPCTPKGIMRLLEEYDVELEGKSVCVIGRSNIVGRPIARMMEQANATVTLCHSKTREFDLFEAVLNADIVASAVGKVGVMSPTRPIVWSDKVIIDVGMNRDENGKLCGDFSEELKQMAAYFTPVPKGVGAMTVAMLMENVIEYYEKSIDK